MQLQLQMRNGGSKIWQPTSLDAYTSYIGNPQTDHLLSVLELPHVWTQPFKSESKKNENNAAKYLMAQTDKNEIDLDDIMYSC